MHHRFDRELANFLRQQQGDQTATQYAQRLGLHRSTYYKILALDQSVTLRKLGEMMDRMGWKFENIFKGKNRRRR